LDMACDGCHKDHSSVHAAQSVECASCHTDEAGLATVHADATVDGPKPTKLKSTTVEVATCQSAGCHDQAEADFFALTAHIDTLVDVQGTKANPHEVMTLTAGHKDIVCADCHSEHGPELDEAMVCVSCHHMGTYECNTCHEAA
ncbi:MAG: cytochrome c3 family protein, partial [Eggerthellaceae bacterium]|nr:cytochrome c3 family protein [Eggerthellaceae bacterium]